jgi:hypothetical protein
MKRCEYCGKQYADPVSICPADGHPTVNPEAVSGLAASPPIGRAAFNARVISPVSAAGSYRVFVRGGDLIFIQTQKASSQILNVISPFLGPFGGFATLLGWFFSRHKARDYQERLQSDDPENLLRDSDKNFRLHLAEIRQAAVEPAAFWSLGGGEAGRLALSIRHDEMLKLSFATRGDLNAAWQLLASRLSSIVQADVEWNDKKRRYQKKSGKNIDRKQL